MTTTDERQILRPEQIATPPHPVSRSAKGSLLDQLVRTTDHKLIGRMYLVTAFGVLALGGVPAHLSVINADLRPDGTTTRR